MTRLPVTVIVNDMSEVDIDAALVRDDLLEEVDRLAREGRFDYLLIESSGISEPMPVAATFAFPRDDGATLGDLPRLDTVVTVVDAANILPELAGAAARLTATRTRLNPAARIVPATRSEVDVREVLGTGRFGLERAQQAPGWVMELNGDHVPETEEYGISSTVFRSERPFHPGRPHVTGPWPKAGAVTLFEPSGACDADTAQSQELVFIGTGLRADAFRAALADCLPADGEPRPATDPFPAWDVYGIDETCEHDHEPGTVAAVAN